VSLSHGSKSGQRAAIRPRDLTGQSEQCHAPRKSVAISGNWDLEAEARPPAGLMNTEWHYEGVPNLIHKTFDASSQMLLSQRQSISNGEETLANRTSSHPFSGRSIGWNFFRPKHGLAVIPFIRLVLRPSTAGARRKARWTWFG
jgi:hypothetical protein